MKKYFRFLDKLRNPLPGSGNAYVIAIIGAVAAGSYFLTGGLMPHIDQNPINPEHVEIDDSSIIANKDTLQLVNIQPKPSATPATSVTPTVSVNPSSGTPPATPTRQPTLPPQACLNNTAIDLLIDTSTSMVSDSNASKLRALQNALGDFVGQLRDDNTVIGAQKFGGDAIADDGLTGVDTIFNFQRYGDNKSGIASALKSVTANTGGGTYTRNGFRLALRKISAAQDASSPFKDYNFITIVFTDGVPEVSGDFGSQCVVDAGDPQGAYKCFAKEQDPRGALINGVQTSDYVSQMNTRTDKIYAIAIYNSDPSTLEGQVSGELVKLMQTIAGSKRAPLYQAVDLDNGSAGDLTSYFQKILAGICS